MGQNVEDNGYEELLNYEEANEENVDLATKANA